nr:hypothetical protein [Methanobrevibacter arboriphilus]
MFGTDIDNRGIVTSTGDIMLVSEYNNITQSLKKRLLTRKGAYSYFDSDYGSILQEGKGFKKNKATFEYLSLEIDTEIIKDERIKTSKTSFSEKGFITQLTLYDGTKTNMIISEEVEEWIS